MRALLLCGLASITISLAPSITAQEPAATRAVSSKDVIELLQGGWVLRELEAPAFEKKLRQERAIMVVGGNFLSMEIHLAWDLRENDEWIDGYFQSGTSRLWMEPNGELMAKSMIGAATDEDYTLEFEAPGKERRYQVSFFGENEVTLRVQDGPMFRFVRMRNDESKVDFFGRKVKTG
jgi:hypothetical protein